MVFICFPIENDSTHQFCPWLTQPTPPCTDLDRVDRNARLVDHNVRLVDRNVQLLLTARIFPSRILFLSDFSPFHNCPFSDLSIPELSFFKSFLSKTVLFKILPDQNCPFPDYSFPEVSFFRFSFSELSFLRCSCSDLICVQTFLSIFFLFLPFRNCPLSDLPSRIIIFRCILFRVVIVHFVHCLFLFEMFAGWKCPSQMFSFPE